MGDIRIKIAGRGVYQTSAEEFDLLMSLYLPASVNELRAKIAERRGYACQGHTDQYAVDHAATVHCDGVCVDHFADLGTVTACLVVLGELSGLATR